MVEYSIFNLSVDDCYNQSIDRVVTSLYDAIPSHEMYDVLVNTDVRFLLSYYSSLYTKLSRLHAIVITEYQSRTPDRSYHLKNIFEQALKAVKFQYEALSRRITIESDEKATWSNNKTF